MDGSLHRAVMVSLGLAAACTLTAGCGTKLATATATAERTPGTASACTGVPACSIVATTDVTGDQRPDSVGWRRVDDGRIIAIRVAGSDGTRLVRRVDVHLWPGGGAWGGAAFVDGNPGRELLIGSTMGAHTPLYTMLTVRSGRLVVEPSPSEYGPQWLVDAAYGDVVGWWRHRTSTGSVTMTQRVALRNDSTSTFDGTDTTFTWQNGRWVQTADRHRHYTSERAASAIGGFHLRGLARFPGLG